MCPERDGPDRQQGDDSSWRKALDKSQKEQRQQSGMDEAQVGIERGESIMRQMEQTTDWKPRGAPDDWSPPPLDLCPEDSAQELINIAKQERAARKALEELNRTHPTDRENEKLRLRCDAEYFKSESHKRRPSSNSSGN